MNNITLFGKILDKQINHERKGKTFYSSHIEIERTSGVLDTLKLIYTDDLKDAFVVDEKIAISGKTRSYSHALDDKSQSNKTKLEVYVQVDDILSDKPEKNNLVKITGIICKKPILRETPLKRSICDLFIVNKDTGIYHSYIPVIAWGKVSKSCSVLEMGDEIEIEGRLQSREYTKTTENETVSFTTYEISADDISSAKIVKEEKEEDANN